MGILNRTLDALAKAVGKRIQGIEVNAAFTDAGMKGVGYSVESMVCESLTNLMMLNYSMPVSGSSDRAKLLDAVSDEFTRGTMHGAVSTAFLHGDSITVPSWDGRRMDNVIVDSNNFAILGANGNEITAVAYVVDKKKERYGAEYTLLRLVELVPYTSDDGTKTNANVYRTFIAKNGTITDTDLSAFPDWAATNEKEWFIPNVDRLLIGRYRSFALNPNDPNAQKGTPICYGASEPIREIHYLTKQMHNEFALSEKAIIADKSLFKREVIRDSDGNIINTKLVLPKGKERLFIDVRGTENGGMIKEWAPAIQLQPYLDALEEQYRAVERCIGVSSGVLSNVNEQSYQNVDNVRKATIKTQSFINSARSVAENYLDQMVYAWNAILNYYGVTPVGDFEIGHDWSDDYINTFADQQNAILAGTTIGATDAVDYRVFVMGEAPEAARENVERIRREKASASANLVLME